MNTTQNKISEYREKIDTVDLDSVKFRLVRDERWTKERAEEVEPLYKGYLLLIALNPPHPVVPTREVDKMWHTHILDTKKYAEDCDKAFGRFIHHVPSRADLSVDESNEMTYAFNETKNMFREVNGFEFDKTFPPEHARELTSTVNAICQGRPGPPNCKSDCYAGITDAQPDDDLQKMFAQNAYCYVCSDCNFEIEKTVVKENHTSGQRPSL